MFFRLDAAKTKTEELKFEVQAHKEALDDAGKKAAEAEERFVILITPSTFTNDKGIFSDALGESRRSCAYL